MHVLLSGMRPGRDPLCTALGRESFPSHELTKDVGTESMGTVFTKSCRWRKVFPVLGAAEKMASRPPLIVSVPWCLPAVLATSSWR